MIWLPTVWTGLNEDIGSWKMRAISAPRIERIRDPLGSSLARSTTCPAPPRPDGRVKVDLAVHDPARPIDDPHDRPAP